MQRKLSAQHWTYLGHQGLSGFWVWLIQASSSQHKGRFLPFLFPLVPSSSFSLPRLFWEWCSGLGIAQSSLLFVTSGGSSWLLVIHKLLISTGFYVSTWGNRHSWPPWGHLCWEVVLALEESRVPKASHTHTQNTLPCCVLSTVGSVQLTNIVCFSTRDFWGKRGIQKGGLAQPVLGITKGA